MCTLAGKGAAWRGPGSLDGSVGGGGHGFQVDRTVVREGSNRKAAK